MPSNRRAKDRVEKHLPRRVPPPTAAEVKRLIYAMPTLTVRGVVAVAAYSGMRMSEILAMSWPDIRPGLTPDTRQIHVPYGKGQKKRTAILLAPGVPWLPATATEGLVFLNGAGRPWSRQGFHQWWGPNRPADLAHVWFHDLRKFYATTLLDAGASDLDVACALGHFDRLGRPNPDYVRMVYGFPSTRDALERIANLPLDGGPA